MHLCSFVLVPILLLSTAALATSPSSPASAAPDPVSHGSPDQDAPGAATHDLVKAGKPAAVIVVSPDAPKMVALAANLFQKYVRDMTGATLAIQQAPSQKRFNVFLGESAATRALGITSAGTRDGGFKIVSGDDFLVLLGDDRTSARGRILSDPEWDALTAPDRWLNPSPGTRDYNPDYDIHETDGRGTMNAVHEFLYDRGMRWYYPSADGTIIPNRQNLSFPATNRVVNPDFSIRHLYLYYKKFGHLTTRGYPGGNLEGSRDEHLNWLLSLRINNISEYVAGRFTHGLDAVTGRAETQLNHPEYYAVWDGKLMNGQNGNAMKQNLCSPELLNATIRYAKKMLDLYPDHYVSVWPADGFTRVSEHSQPCRDKATPERGPSGAISDYVWDFVNNVAWAIHDDPAYGPKRMILGGAYTAYQLPPQHLSDRRGMAPNIAIMITKWRTWTGTPENQAYYRELTQRWANLLPSGKVFTYDYYLHNRLERVTESTPIFYPRLIAQDLAFLKGKSAGEFVEIATNWPPWNLAWDSFAAQALNTSITARLYWDANQDVETLLNEYYDLYYGPASQKMKKLHEYSENHFASLAYKPEFLQTMRAMAQDALAMTGENTVYRKRISRLLGLMNARYLGKEFEIGSCQTLDSPGTTYRLAQDVTAPKTCFPVNASGITLDCRGHAITFGTDQAEGSAVQIDARRSQRGHDSTISNCTIHDGSRTEAAQPGPAIDIRNADHAVVENTRIDTAGAGIRVMGGTRHVFRGNTVNARLDAFFAQYGGHSTPEPESSNVYENNAFSSRDGYGAYLYQGGEDLLRNNTFTSVNSHGLRLFRPTKTRLFGNTIASESTQGLQMLQPTDLELIENTVIDH